MDGNRGADLRRSIDPYLKTLVGVPRSAGAESRLRMLICPGCHVKVADAEAWMMCPECGFVFEDDDNQPTSPGREGIKDPDVQPRPAKSAVVELDPNMVYPTDMTADDLGENMDDYEA